MSATAIPRRLEVTYEGRRVGTLEDAAAGWRFVYDEAWLAAADGFDLAPALPRAERRFQDGGSTRAVQWFFDNLLPEEGARALLAKDADIAQADAFGLLTWYGAESAGALVLLAPDASVPEGGIRPLPDKELSRRIRDLPRHSLSHEAPKRMSLAGAQHKLAVAMLEGDLYEPVGPTPSTHILKPDHVQVEHYPHSVANEWFTMRLAAGCGLLVPEVAIRAVPEPVYLVRRFDRLGEWPSLKRRHVLDGCQLLSLDRQFKYQQSTTAALNRMIDLNRRKAQTRIRLFQWALFNALVGNGDAHLKNLSFFLGPQGIELAPHYDLVSTASYAPQGGWGDEDLSVAMGDARKFADLRRPDALAFAEELGIPPKLSARLMDELLQRVGPALREINAGIQGEALLDAGAQRQLRLIEYGVLSEMRRQLE